MIFHHVFGRSFKKIQIAPITIEEVVVRPRRILAITSQEALTLKQITSYLQWFVHAEAHAQ